MKVTVIEGTPSELAQAFPKLFAGEALIVKGQDGPAVIDKPPAKSAPQFAADAAPVYVTKAVAQATLRRRPLATGQRTVLKMVYSAHPNTVLATDLQAKLSFSSSQFAGLMGAFGRRLTNTKGFVPYTNFFSKDWDYQAGCFRYGMPDAVREAMDEEAWAR